ncbi:MAG TPA: AI-2E family transporter [Deltaproteobacteria bacterium]|nr:AI-2E family transporter [Deltaproteobacteria bacterium]HPR56129.1 AI-2E family transporter [Deltaproteobacteria bacterium]HXK48320.1 AI-2E family transporter [Deltaproteobacteria bacterium]
MDFPRDDPGRSNLLVIGASFVIIIAGMKAASGIIVPFLLSFFIAVMCGGPFTWMQKKRVPPFLAVSIIVICIIAVLLAVGAYIGASVNDFLQEIPQYQVRIQDEFINLTIWLRGFGIHISQRVVDYFDPASIMQIIANILSGLGGVLTNTFLILFTVVFILLESSTFLSKIKAAFRISPYTVETFDFVFLCVGKYLAIKTWMSLATGISVMLWLMAIGVNYPVLWGLVAFLLHYIPNIGSLIAAIPAILFALVDSSLGTALLATVGYALVNLIFGNILEPIFMGRGLSLSTLVVFVSLIFWGWVLGPVGMLLSAPLTMIFKIAFEGFPSTRWVAILLDSEVPLPLDMPPAKTDAPGTAPRR